MSTNFKFQIVTVYGFDYDHGRVFYIYPGCVYEKKKKYGHCHVKAYFLNLICNTPSKKYLKQSTITDMAKTELRFFSNNGWSIIHGTNVKIKNF